MTSSTTTATLSDRTSYLRATNAPSLSILEATASWCPQCRAIEPALQTLIAKFPNATFYKYDVDASPDIAQELGVNSMPSFHLFRDGELLGGITGPKVEELRKMVGSYYVEVDG